MNANVALLEPEKVAGPCAEELARINESLQARERLLTASARASRLLLEAPDVRAAIPSVLGMIGEAARVDRVNLMLGYNGPNDERLLTVVSEWTAEHGTVSPPPTPVCTCNESSCRAVFAELRSGLEQIAFIKQPDEAGIKMVVDQQFGLARRIVFSLFHNCAFDATTFST